MKRYEAIEIDGSWYVMDHRNPEKAPVERKDAEDARISTIIWNGIVAGAFEAWINDRS